MGTLDITEEERKRRSENMKRLHAEGRAGGSEFGRLGGRPKQKRISEILSEKAQKEAEQIWERLRLILYEEKSNKIFLDAFKEIRIMEEQERKIEVEEEVRYEQLKHNELAELVIGNLFELVRGGQIDLGEIIDGEIVEERQAIGSGESN